MHSSSRQWKSVPSQDKRTLSPLIFYIQCYKTQAKACDRSLTSFYCDHADLTSIDRIQQENKSRPGNFFAGTMHGDCIWPDQKCPYRNSWSHGEIVTAGLDLLFCWFLSLCPVPRLWTEWMGCTAHSTGEDLPSSTPRWFQVNSSCRTQSRFPLNSPEGQASRRNWNINTGAWCFRSMAKIQQLLKKVFFF